jgi:hypothetical protein
MITVLRKLKRIMSPKLSREGNWSKQYLRKVRIWFIILSLALLWLYGVTNK